MRSGAHPLAKSEAIDWSDLPVARSDSERDAAKVRLERLPALGFDFILFHPRRGRRRYI